MKQYNFKEIGAQEAEEHIKMTYELAPIIGHDPLKDCQHHAEVAMEALERLVGMGRGDCDEAERLRGYLSRFD